MVEDDGPVVVSLRVPGMEHGGPEAVLGARSTEQVDDVVTRGEFWRWRRQPPTDYTTEGYLWAVRSSPTARALWMLLLPFTLINVAYWARPAHRRGPVTWAADAAMSMLCRLLGLALTATLMLSAVGVALDLVAWQCLGQHEGCTNSWPQPLNLIGEARLTTGQRLAVGALAPLLLLAVLSLAGYRTWMRYERRVDIEPQPDWLSDARFWRGRSWVERLRAAHRIVGLTVVAGSTVYPLLRTDLRTGGPLAGVGVGLLGLLGLALTVAVVGTAAPLPLASPTGPGGRLGRLGARVRSAAASMTAVVRATAWVTIATTIGCLVYAALPRPADPQPAGALPGYAAAVAVNSVLLTLLLLGFGVATLPLCRLARHAVQRSALRGLAAPVIATVAAMLAVGEAASTLYFAALLIGQLKTTGTVRAWEPAPPYPYEWVGPVFVVALVFAMVAALVHWYTWRRLLRAGRRTTDARDPSLRAADPDVARVLDHAHARGAVMEHMPKLLLIVFVPATALAFAGVAFSAAGQGPSTLLRSQNALTNLGTWSIGLVALSLTVFGMRAGLTTPVQRLISAVWATATFWPRAAHPFGAPSHGPRSVADVVLRVTRLTRRGRLVLLGGHSHGALITTTAVLYLPRDVARRTALLTSASPVTRLIRPYFGAFLDRARLVDVAERLTDERGTRWGNLYRITDPIGGPVFGTPGAQPFVAGRRVAIDRLVPDPDLVNLRAGTDATPRGHGDYLSDPAFIAAHAELVARLTAELRPARSAS